MQANSLQSIWTKDGAKVVEVDSSIPSPPAVVGDYTPFASKIMTSNGGQPPDLVTIVGSVSDTLLLYKKLSQLGFKGVVQDYDLYDPHFAATTTGLVTNVQIEPFEAASSVPAVQTMIADLKAYDPNFTTSQTTAAGYWTADFLIQALKKVGPDLSARRCTTPSTAASPTTTTVAAASRSSGRWGTGTSRSVPATSRPTAPASPSWSSRTTPCRGSPTPPTRSPSHPAGRRADPVLTAYTVSRTRFRKGPQR